MKTTLQLPPGVTAQALIAMIQEVNAHVIERDGTGTGFDMTPAGRETLDAMVDYIDQ